MVTLNWSAERGILLNDYLARLPFVLFITVFWKNFLVAAFVHIKILFDQHARDHPVCSVTLFYLFFFLLLVFIDRTGVNYFSLPLSEFSAVLLNFISVISERLYFGF